MGCEYNSYVARRLLRENGVVLIGLACMDEFGMGSLGAHFHGYFRRGEEGEGMR